MSLFSFLLILNSRLNDKLGGIYLKINVSDPFTIFILTQHDHYLSILVNPKPVDGKSYLFIPKCSENVANLLPLIADYKVSSTGTLIPTFRNQIAYLNIYDPLLSSANYNICINSTSGGRKSVLTQTIINYHLSLGGRIWVIDLGESYKKSCKIHKGPVEKSKKIVKKKEKRKK